MLIEEQLALRTYSAWLIDWHSQQSGKEIFGNCCIDHQQMTQMVLEDFTVENVHAIICSIMGTNQCACA